MNTVTPPVSGVIARRLVDLQTRVHQSCAQSGRDPGAVTLVAVSKNFDLEAIGEAIEAGQQHFGENYIQEAVRKIHALQDARVGKDLIWHCIGPVQSNKTRLVAEYFDWVHTIDRLKIAERLSEQRPATLPPLNVCIQVNVDGELNKSGLAPSEVAALAKQVAALPHLRLRGLMSIPQAPSDAPGADAPHRVLKRLFDDLKARLFRQKPEWDTLSMGMSADFESAIAAGSTLVRLGTAIFGPR